MSFFINPTIKRIIVAFWYMVYHLFFRLLFQLFLICFLQYLFVKRSNDLFTVKITNIICPWHSFLKFFNHKRFFWPIWNVTFYKIVFIFWYCNMINNLGYSLLKIPYSFFFLLKSIYMLNFNGIHLDFGMICIVVFTHYFIYFLNN